MSPFMYVRSAPISRIAARQELFAGRTPSGGLVAGPIQEHASFVRPVTSPSPPETPQSPRTPPFQTMSVAQRATPPRPAFANASPRGRRWVLWRAENEHAGFPKYWTAVRVPVNSCTISARVTYGRLSRPSLITSVRPSVHRQNYGERHAEEKLCIVKTTHEGDTADTRDFLGSARDNLRVCEDRPDLTSLSFPRGVLWHSPSSVPICPACVLRFALRSGWRKRRSGWGGGATQPNLPYVCFKL